MKYLIFFLIYILPVADLHAQHPLSLSDVITIAQSRSASYKLIETERKISAFRYATYVSSLKPSVSMYGRVPAYSRQYTPIIQPNGEVKYLALQQNVNRVGLSLSQQLLPTGAVLSLNSELTHFYNFASKYKQYNSTPVFFRLSQPVFGFNKLKWDKRIEPLKLEESNRNYILKREDIACQATVLFFDVLLAQTNIEIAKSNLIVTSENLELERKRIALGTTTEDKLLQLQLYLLKSRQDRDEAEYNYRMAAFRLRSFLSITDEQQLTLEIRQEIPDLKIDLDQAINYAKKNRPEYITFQRKQIEAERDIHSAKTNNRQVTVDFSYGLNQASDRFKETYNDLKAQQNFEITFNLPIIDWGRNKASYKMAKAAEQLVMFDNNIQDINIRQEITTIVNNVELLKGKILLAKSADSISQARFVLANKLYQIGRISVNDLNIAQTEKDNSIRSNLYALRDFWIAYYLLRKLTIYDFAAMKDLSTN